MASKLGNAERFKSKTNHALYCVNIYGSGLKATKDEFKRQVSTGLRQTVFVLDLEDLQTELNYQQRITKTRKDLNGNSSTDLMHVVLNHIQEILKEYEKFVKKIKEELKFDLYEYWLKENNVTKNSKPDKANKAKSMKDSENVKRKEKEETCTSSLIVKEHNRIGQPNLLNRKYIKDEPILGKLYIIILGQMSKSFLKDLLRRDQSVEAIINFIPTESNYDILLGNNTLQNFILTTLETISKSVLNLRQEIILKSVGLFTRRLPVISNCSATKNSREIFDQLTWCIYDIDILRAQYESYYFKPFQVTNVEIPASENITQLYHVAESLSIQGRFQKSSLPASEADLASIAGYLNSLLSTCGVHGDVKTERSQTNFLLPNAFSTITNICKFDRLVVAENNYLLLNMLKYADLDNFSEIYLCCLDYNELGQFAIPQQPEALTKTTKRDADQESQLPQYVKYYANRECTWQRITELKREYDEYDIRKFPDGYKLYIFKRSDYILKTCVNSVIIPTRLCFRDFTLFQMEEFLKDLKPPKVNYITYKGEAAKATEFEKYIFERPNSLKALMLQKALSEEIPKRKNESSSGRRSGSSLSKNSALSEEQPGLPTGHRLLKGYNLNDTLQEVKVKTSMYSFLHGCIKLYEENWCFQEMNKQLSVTINNATLFFSGARNRNKGISNNVRLVTKDDISIRILNTHSECSRVVMNYPNGLSIYQHADHCEQIWHCTSSPRDEQKRILTNFGAIIVFFKSHDVKVMRYNGEVYRLYQHDLEEEEDGEDIKNRSSELTESNFQKQRLREGSLSKTRNTSKARHSKKLSSEESLKSSSISKPSTSDLISSLKFEFDFFNFLCATYGLTYLCFSITTSQGKVINVTQQGELSERQHCSINEWFDYFANEAYCKRSDGVKMIWGQESFKCFHEDGTVFTTSMVENFTVADKDEFESLITQSSLHEVFLEQTETSYHQPAFDTQSSSSDITSALNKEVYKPFDVPFIEFKCQDMFMEHPNYAQVFIKDLGSKPANLEIFATNSIRIYTDNKRECNENELEICGDFQKDKSHTELTVNVWIHKNLKFKVGDESCEVWAAIPNKTKAGNDSLCLSLKYTDNVNDAFNGWMKEIDDSFKLNKEQVLSKLYFMEKNNYDTSIRGFEFFPLLPTTSRYKYQTSNNIVELKGIDTINGAMLYNSKEHENDLKKFTRSKQKQKEKNYQQPENELPSSLSANVYIEIPQQLRNLTNITKFLEPFEKMYFKRLRGKFKDALTYYLRPQYQLYLKILCSRINWKKRISEHDRRLFHEKQRSGLYVAMIKHETYPNYWKFNQVHGNDVRCIEFFDFVKNQCKCDND